MERLPLSRNLGRTNRNPVISSLVSSPPPLLLSLLPKLKFSKGNQLKQNLIMWHLKELFTTVRDSQQMCCWDCPCLVLVMKKAMTEKGRGDPPVVLNTGHFSIAVMEIKGKLHIFSDRY